MTQNNKTPEPLITAEEYAKSLKSEASGKIISETSFNGLARSIVKFILIGTIILALLLLWFIITFENAVYG